MPQVISKNEALKEMEKTDSHGSRIPFRIAFITADRAAWAKKKRLIRELEQLKPETNEYDSLKQRIDNIDTGGKIVEGYNCMLNGMRGIHSQKGKTQKQDPVAIEKHPHHWENRTRNILFAASQQIRKCRISLICMFNGKEVTY